AARPCGSVDRACRTPRRGALRPSPLVSRRLHSERARTRDLIQSLDDHGHALATSNTHGLESDRLIECLEVVEQRAQDAGAGHAEWMTESDGSAVRIQFVAEWVDAQFAS